MAIVRRNAANAQADVYVLRPAGELFVGEETPKMPLPVKEYADQNQDEDEFPSESAPDAEGVPEILIPLALILIIIICVPSWIGIEIFRILAAVRMRRAYHAIRELTE